MSVESPNEGHAYRLTTPRPKRKKTDHMIISITDVSPSVVRIRLTKNTSDAERADILHRASNCNTAVSISGRTITIRSLNGDGIPAWAYRAAWGDSVNIRPEP